NGGLNFNILLAGNTPNDGVETVLLPSINCSNARIKVEAIGNIFFAINSAAFSIGLGQPNNAPVLDASRSPALNPENEDSGPPIGAVGTLVSSLVDFATPSGQVDNVTDVDSSAVLGFAITASDTANGTWFYSLNNGATWIPLGALSSAN